MGEAGYEGEVGELRVETWQCLRFLITGEWGRRTTCKKILFDSFSFETSCSVAPLF